MNRRAYVSIVAGIATLLSTTALTGVFDGYSWLAVVGGGVIVVVLAGLGARAAGAPGWLQPLVELLGLALYITTVFGHDRFLGIIPTPGTIAGLRADVSTAFADIAELVAPVPARPGILMLTVAGVGLVAILVDLLAAVLGRAALAGLPLLGLYTVPVAVDRDGIGWFPFALGAAGFCWLLAAEHGDQIRGWGRPFQAAAASQSGDDGARARMAPTRMMGSRLAVFGIVLAVLIPAGVPALSADGLHNLFEGGFPGSSSGRTVTAVNPVTELRGQLTQTDPVNLLQVKTTDSEPFYLRLATLSEFTGNGWTLPDLNAKPEARVSNGVPDVSGLDSDVPTTKQKTSIKVLGFTKSSFLPLYANPTKVDVKGDWRFDRNSEAVFSTSSQTGGLNYQFTSKRVDYSSTLLQNAPELPANSPVASYTVLKNPEPSVKAKVASLTSGRTSEYEKVLAINNFFSPSNGFVYSLETAPGTSKSAIVDFLQKKHGYCEQYASAMAYMVRVAGLPARVAVGFGYGTQNGDSWTITSHDAHAWVEVYFSGIGWVPFDPTPPSGTDSRTGQLAWVNDPVTDTGTNPDQTEQQQPTDANPSPSAAEPSPSASTAAPDANADKASGQSRSILATIGAVLAWGLAIVALIALAAAPALVRRRLRRQRFAAVGDAGDPAAAAHAAWDEVIDTLVDLDAGADEVDTPRRLSSRLREDGLDDQAQGALALLATAEEQARYAPRVAMVPGLADAVVTVRSALHQRSTKSRRLIAEIVPASTIERVGSFLRGLLPHRTR